MGKAPLGYLHLKAASGRGAWAEPNPETTLALMAVLEGYASGNHSFLSLAKELNAKGLTTGAGKPFTESSISTILNNPFYEGKFVYHRGRPDATAMNSVHQVPERVKELWRRCQEVRRDKAQPGQPAPRSRQQRVYPLTGVLVCDSCGQPFHGLSSINKGNSSRRMFHSWRRCDMRPLSVAANRVEDEFVEKVLSHTRLDEGWRAAVLNALTRESPMPDHGLELKRIEGAIANLKKQHIWGTVDDDSFKAEFQHLDRQRRTLRVEATPVQLPNLERAAQLLQDLPTLWQHPGVKDEHRRSLAREVFEEPRLREGKLVAAKPRPEYAPLFAYSIWRHGIVGGTRSS